MLDHILWSGLAVILSIVFIGAGQMVLFPRKNHFPVDGCTVVITGGSQGIGRGLAKQFSQRGANIVLVARNVKKLEDALKYVSAAALKPASQRFHLISADVTRPEENVRIIDEVTRWNGGQPPDIVWANAGVCIPKLFMESSIEEMRSQMDLNYWAAAYLARATLQSWLSPASAQPDASTGKGSSRPARHFIMTCSTAAFCAVAGYSLYSPAKAAMRSLADSLRSEINLYNGARRRDPSKGPAADIKIRTLFAGTTRSPGWERENEIKHPITKILEEDDPVQTEDEVAVVAFKELEKGHQLISTQMLATAMRVSALGGSPRNNWLVDTVLSWVTSVAWLFIQPDMDGKVFKYGKQHGVSSRGVK